MVGVIRWNPDGLLQRCVKALKKEVPDILVITDVALDPYNSDGHDGYVRELLLDCHARDR